MKPLTVKAFLLAFLLAATAAVTAAGAADCPPPAGHYALATVDGSPISFPNPVYIEFGSENSLSGQICNTFRGKAALTDCILTMTQAAATRRMCIDAKLSELEARFFRMLSDGVAVILVGDELTLRRDGGSLVFRKE